jgi:hypothetical protein
VCIFFSDSYLSVLFFTVFSLALHLPVNAPMAVLNFRHISINFSQWHANCTAQTKTFTVTNILCAQFFYFSDDQSWISVTKGAGFDAWGLLAPGVTGTVNVSISASSLAIGTHTGNTTVTNLETSETVPVNIMITASEICDGEDNNCNGATDEGGASRQVNYLGVVGDMCPVSKQ